MLKEFDVGGVYFAPMALYAAIAIAIFMALSTVLRRLGVDLERLVWHKPLFRTALFVIILSLVVISVMAPEVAPGAWR